MSDFSDFIIYADESGSPVLDGVDPDYPVFVLALMLTRKDTYVQNVVPSIQKLKFDFVGHDQLILHERDIRRQKGAFSFLQTDPALRADFLTRIDKVVSDADIEIFSAVIDKNKLKSQYAQPFSPYSIALMFCMERLLNRLVSAGQAGRTIHVVFECRGAKEDAGLELEFRRIASNQSNWGYKNTNFKLLSWEPKFVDKRCNSTGLQLADLVARPIGLKRVRPAQTNHAYDVIAPKIPFGSLKWFP